MKNTGIFGLLLFILASCGQEEAVKDQHNYRENDVIHKTPSAPQTSFYPQQQMQLLPEPGYRHPTSAPEAVSTPQKIYPTQLLYEDPLTHYIWTIAVWDSL